jgi:hypothetical protein
MEDGQFSVFEFDPKHFQDTERNLPRRMCFFTKLQVREFDSSLERRRSRMCRPISIRLDTLLSLQVLELPEFAAHTFLQRFQRIRHLFRRFLEVEIAHLFFQASQLVVNAGELLPILRCLDLCRPFCRLVRGYLLAILARSVSRPRFGACARTAPFNRSLLSSRSSVSTSDFLISCSSLLW